MKQQHWRRRKLIQLDAKEQYKDKKIYFIRCKTIAGEKKAKYMRKEGWDKEEERKTRNKIYNEKKEN